MLSLTKYSGSKMRFLNKILPIINHSKKSIYVEPFLGSGSVFLNLEKDFEQYYLNDLNPFVINVFQTIKDIEFEEFIFIRDKNIKEFGDFRQNKESYYLMRNYANTIDNKYEQGVLTYYVMKTCINGFFRINWKEMKMNQGFGTNCINSEISKEEFHKIKNKLSKAILSSIDYNELEFNNAFYFLDPPYSDRDMAGYDTSFFDKNNFLEFIKNKEFIYTDILDRNINYDYLILQEKIKNNGPNKSQNSNLSEVMYYNIEYKQNNLF